MLLQSVLLLALAASASVVSGEETTPVTFFTDEGINGVRVACTGADTYGTCYNVDNVALAGLSSLFYTDRDPYKDQFSLTLYAGPGCNGQYDRWSFEVPPGYAGFYIEKFHTMNDKVRSFKFHDAQTSNVKGGFVAGGGEVRYGNVCQFDTARKSMPPSNAVKG
jgi:hypothetical protein